jgi:hypothetical protein
MKGKMMSKEIEWEYGLVNPDALPREFGRDEQAHLVSGNREHIEKQWKRGSPKIMFVKRVKAGQWVLGTPEGDNS